MDYFDESAFVEQLPHLLRGRAFAASVKRHCGAEHLKALRRYFAGKLTEEEKEDLCWAEVPHAEDLLHDCDVMNAFFDVADTLLSLSWDGSGPAHSGALSAAGYRNVYVIQCTDRGLIGPYIGKKEALSSEYFCIQTPCPEIWGRIPRKRLLEKALDVTAEGCVVTVEDERYGKRRYLNDNGVLKPWEDEEYE